MWRTGRKITTRSPTCSSLNLMELKKLGTTGELCHKCWCQANTSDFVPVKRQLVYHHSLRDLVSNHPLKQATIVFNTYDTIHRYSEIAIANKWANVTAAWGGVWRLPRNTRNLPDRPHPTMRLGRGVSSGGAVPRSYHKRECQFCSDGH